MRPPLRQATRGLGIEVTAGYDRARGASIDEVAEAMDDAHDDDRGILVDQALEPAARGGVEDVHALLRPSARFAGLARLTLQTCIPKEYP